VIVAAVANWCEVRSWTRRKNTKTEQSVREPRDVQRPWCFGDGVSLNILHFLLSPGVSLNILHFLADRQTTDRQTEGENEPESWSEPARKK